MITIKFRKNIDIIRLIMANTRARDKRDWIGIK